jgi:hypothetical protein
MRWLFSASNNDVKIIILAKFSSTQRVVTLETRQEKEEFHDKGHGTLATRHACRLRPALKQTITITQNLGTNPVSYNITRGALELEFRLLFPREPVGGEANIVVNIPT